MAAVNTKSSGNSAKDLYELKQKAVKYYTENGVPDKMEEILNSMFQANPQDVYGHLANYFESFAKVPVITKVRGRQGFDGKGQPTTQTEVYCIIKNQEKLVCTCVSPSYSSHLLDNAKAEDKDVDDKERMESVIAAISFLNTDICNKMETLDPTQQDVADSVAYNFFEKLVEDEKACRAAEETETPEEESKPVVQPGSESSQSKKTKSPTGKGKVKPSQVVVIPDEPQEKFPPGSGMVSAISQAVCMTGALIQHTPVYQHIAAMREELPEEYKLPLPIATIIQNGKAAAGKLNCVKEFMVVPKPGMSFKEGVEKIMAIYNHVSKSLYSKGGVLARNVNDIGALCPQFDKPEQGLDLLLEAMTALGLIPGEDFHIALNIAGQEMFDLDKGKYEVAAGQQKSPDDHVDFWLELLGRYPAVNLIIDPMRKQESDQWLRLCDRITDHCYVVGDYGYHRPGILKDEELDDEFRTSGIVLKLEQVNTITDLVACAKKMEDAENQIILAACQGETTDDFIADLAVGLNCRFLKIGAPCRGERISKINRLLQIEEELVGLGMLGYHEDHAYPHIALPPPPEGEMEAAEAPPTPKKESKKK